jgi:hypothetical protein
MPFFRHRLPLLAAMLFAAAGAQAGTLVSQGFDDVGTLSGDGWLLVNANPDPAYTLDWFQGNPDVFPAHGGADDAYIASTWGAAAAGATLQNWLITPAFSTDAAGTVTFWLRGAADPGYTDTVSVGFSAGGTSAASFMLGAPIAASGDWTEYSFGFAAAGAGSTARFAIEQTGSADLADYVGIDDLSVRTRAVTTVPEPANALLLAAGLLGLAAWRRRSAR